MRSSSFILSLFISLFCLGDTFRPPAAPLVVNDPFMNVWCTSDELYQSWPVHWTGQVKAICGLIRVDGKVFRWCGPAGAPPVAQRKLVVRPLTTKFIFGAGGVNLQVEFLSPCLPGRLDLATRPVTYLTMSARSEDGKPHEVSLYIDISAEWAVTDPKQKVKWTQEEAGGLAIHKIRRLDQQVLKRSCDRCYITWGSAILAAPVAKGVKSFAASHAAARKGFVDGNIPSQCDLSQPREAGDNWPVFGFTFDLNRVGNKPSERFVMLAYDDEWSVEFFGTKLRPWWRKEHSSMQDLLVSAAEEYGKLRILSNQADSKIEKEAETLGGESYKKIISLAYRQAIAAGKAVISPEGNCYYFSKEISSNGCMSTVDVAYPASPLFLSKFPDLMVALLEPVMFYAESDAWKHPWAPHDIGRYPIARGQAYGGHMPVEESGNMLILASALSKLCGNDEFANRHWKSLTEWADYLVMKGVDPADQLCTDDFTGHLAHNVNLSLKATIAVAAYASLGRKLGKIKDTKYMDKAKEMVRFWEEKAFDSDHYRLAFDRPHTWSMKYNLVWDKVLNLGLFPKKIGETELSYYRRLVQPYGLPLDNRATFTKSDWLVWTASLEKDRTGFEYWLKPLVKFLNETPDRVPFTDWYDTIDPKTKGMFCRPVIGGVFMRFIVKPLSSIK